MSATPGIPGTDLPSPTAWIERRLATVERNTADLPKLVKDVDDLTKYIATIRSYEATVKSLISRGILLILGGIGTTYGVTRATQPPATHETVQVVKSQTTVQVEACTAMQPGPERDQCAIRLLTELMGQRR